MPRKRKFKPVRLCLQTAHLKCEDIGRLKYKGKTYQAKEAMDVLVVEPGAETVLTQKHSKAKGVCN